LPRLGLNQESPVHDFLQDVRFGFRMLVSRPGFTAAAALCLALGIGATTAIFSVVNAVVLRPLPYAQPDRLVRIYTEFPTFPNGGLRRFWTSGPEYFELKRDLRSWETIDAWNAFGANLGTQPLPIRITGAVVTGTLLSTLGVKPVMGRIVLPEDDKPGAPLVADISYGLWQRAFGSDSHVLGKETLLQGAKCTIVGVMPPDFQFPPGEVEPTEIWSPLRLNPANPGGRGGHNFYLLGRLKPGITIDQARSEMVNVVEHAGKLAGPNFHAFHPENHPVVMYSFQEEVVGGVRPAMMMLLGAVVFVLLIACFNVANLLLARSETRQREIAVRAAIGAGRARLLRQFITEGTLLSLLGAIPGLLLAYGSLRVLQATAAGAIPRASEIHIDVGVLLFTLAVSLVTGIFFGLAPVMHVATGQLNNSLKAGAGRSSASVGSQRFRRILAIGELALALVLLIGSGLMVRAFWKLQEVNLGINPHGLMTMRVALPNAVYNNSQTRDSLWTRLLERVRQLPGVQSAALASGLPPIRRPNENDTQIEGFVDPQRKLVQNVAFDNVVSSGYFETMGIRLAEGRYFDARDGAGAPDVAIVNQSMARMFWGNESPIGKRVRPGFTDPWCRVIGVVADVKNAGIDKPARTELYLPYAQKQASGNNNSAIIVQTAGDPNGIVNAVRHELNAIDPTLPLASVRSMEDLVSSARARPRFLMLLLTMFSTISVVLAAFGLYGVISYAVAQRTSEFGIRMALGAQSGDVISMVLGQGLTLGLIGIGCGAIGAVFLTRLMSGLLFEMGAFDVPTFAAMAFLLLLVTLLACYVPALRATRVDPMKALRYE
jgi:putative ABC transport system permease protein